MYTWPVGPSWILSSELVATLVDSANIHEMCVKVCEQLCVVGQRGTNLCVGMNAGVGEEVEARGGSGGERAWPGPLLSPFRERREKWTHKLWDRPLGVSGVDLFRKE